MRMIIVVIVFSFISFCCGFSLHGFLVANARRKRIFPRACKASLDLVTPPPLREEKYFEQWKTVKEIKP